MSTVQKYIVVWALLLALREDLKFTIACQHKQEGWLSPTKRASSVKKPRAEDM